MRNWAFVIEEFMQQFHGKHLSEGEVGANIGCDRLQIDFKYCNGKFNINQEKLLLMTSVENPMKYQSESLKLLPLRLIMLKHYPK